MTVLEPNASAPGDEYAPDLDGGQGATQDEFDVVFANLTGGTSALLDPSAGRDTLERRGDDEREAGDRVGDGAERPAAPPVPLPPPVTTRLRTVSGRYRSAPAGFQLELRVDVDGSRPLHQLSGDYFQVSGGATTYFGSWTIDAVTITSTPAGMVLVGTARTTWSTTFTVARVTIPRRTIFQPAAPATVRWSTSSGAPGATYACSWESRWLRSVYLEQDVERGVTPFVNYDTSSLPSGGPARVLTTGGAYGEAGIQVLDTGANNTIVTSASHIWNDASLHNAMVSHFSQMTNAPQFKVWLLHAMRHELGPGLRGIMFDQQGLHRQGCASFYQVIQAGTAPNLREQLYVNVHELGHCFNLFHSFHKAYMTPPRPNRPGSLSWMNYPGNYNPGNGAPSGAAAFWGAFPFQFDAPELSHLRHGFRDAVIMGGNPFGAGAAYEAGRDGAASTDDRSGLRLVLGTSPSSPELGTPLVLEVALVVDRAQQVHQPAQLHPKYGHVQVFIDRPRGDVVVHRPPVTVCAAPELRQAQPGDRVPVSAYIGYDAVVGQVFEDPGTYRIRATYAALDGTVVSSGTVAVRVRSPRDATGEDVAQLLLGDELGMVLTLLGSDSEFLREGTDALERIVERHGDHPNAVYARLALGMNAARPFTAVHADGSVSVRGRDLDRAHALLDGAVDASRGDGGLDDLSVVQVLSYLADGHAAEGDTTSAASIRSDAARFARTKGAPGAILEAIAEDRPSA